MENDIKFLLYILCALIQRRQQGIRMSIPEKVRFIGLLFEYFKKQISIQYQIQNNLERTKMIIDS